MTDSPPAKSASPDPSTGAAPPSPPAAAEAVTLPPSAAPKRSRSASPGDGASPPEKKKAATEAADGLIPAWVGAAATRAASGADPAAAVTAAAAAPPPATAGATAAPAFTPVVHTGALPAPEAAHPDAGPTDVAQWERARPATAAAFAAAAAAPSLRQCPVTAVFGDAATVHAAAGLRAVPFPPHAVRKEIFLTSAQCEGLLAEPTPASRPRGGQGPRPPGSGCGLDGGLCSDPAASAGCRADRCMWSTPGWRLTRVPVGAPSVGWRRTTTSRRRSSPRQPVAPRAECAPSRRSGAPGQPPDLAAARVRSFRAARLRASSTPFFDAPL